MTLYFLSISPCVCCLCYAFSWNFACAFQPIGTSATLLFPIPRTLSFSNIKIGMQISGMYGVSNVRVCYHLTHMHTTLSLRNTHIQTFNSLQPKRMAENLHDDAR